MHILVTGTEEKAVYSGHLSSKLLNNNRQICPCSHKKLRSVPTFSSYVLSSPPVSNEALRGSSPQTQSQVLQWVSFADAEIIPPASAWVFPTLGIMQFNKQVCTAITVYRRAFQLLFTEITL